jgi:hypothetical protein
MRTVFMMDRLTATFLSALLLAGPAFAAPATRPTTQSAPIDLSTPRAAGKAYADAVLGPSADPVRLREVVVGDDRSLKQAEVAAAHAGAMYELAAALTDKFGEEGRQYGGNREADYAKFIELVGKSRLSEDADKAILTGPGGDFQLVLRKAGGVWKVELTKALDGPDELAKAVAILNGQAKILRELAVEVREGKYASVSAVDKARRERARALLTGMKSK